MAIYQYYMNRISNPVSKRELQNKLGSEFKKVEEKSKGLKHIYGYSTDVHTTCGTVLIHNVTILWLLNAIFSVFGLTMIVLSAIISNPDSLHILTWISGVASAVCTAAGAITFAAGFRNDERRIVDMASPMILCAVLSFIAYLVCGF